jgi:uncharacterized protein YwgA
MVNKNDLTSEQKAILFIVGKLRERFSIDKLYLQKMVFLISKLLPDAIAVYDYEPNDMGMYSPEVELMVKREEDLGLLKGLEITPLGSKVLSEITKEEEIKAIEGIFGDLSELSKEDIVYLVYNLYPEFTTISKIKDIVDSYKLQSATIDVFELPEGKVISIKTDKGNFIRIARHGAVIKIVGYEEGV